MELRELRERLEAAEGPDRELDLDLAITMGTMPPEWNPEDDDRGCYVDPGSVCLSPGVFEAPAYTASLDSAVALVEKVLPGRDWSCVSVDSTYSAWLGPEEEEGIIWPQDNSPTPALALCTALVKALEETQK
jgi:hypothetical protein